jgi:hypothetical protein
VGRCSECSGFLKTLSGKEGFSGGGKEGVCELAECLSQDEDQAIVAEFMRARAQCEIHAKFPRLKYLPKPLSAQMKPAAELARARGASSHR